MALQIDDTITVDGRTAVNGLEDGFTYRVTDFKTFRGRKHYVLKAEDMAEYSKVPVTELDSVLGESSTVKTV